MLRYVVAALAAGYVSIQTLPALAQQSITVWFSKGFYRSEDEALWAAIDRDDDWTPLAAKIEAIRATGALNAALGLLRGPLARPGHVPIEG